MGTISSLLIHSRVPVIIIEDNCVSCDEIHTKTSCSCREQEAENVVVALELVDHVASVLDAGATIHTEEG